MSTGIAITVSVFGFGQVATAEPAESRQNTPYEMCIESANTELIECGVEAGKDTIKAGAITYGATPGTPQIRAAAAELVGGLTLLYNTGECAGEYIARRIECNSEAEERSIRRRARVSRRRRARRNRH